MREQRKHPRHSPPQVALVSTNESFGQIVNISSGGFSFKYLDMETPIQSEDRISLVLDDFTLENIPVTVVWENRIPAPGFESVVLNLVGVRFDNLTYEQQYTINLLNS